ncbi:MAG: hypothetical protein Q8O22_00020 [Candidatus Omnitrophota bacterium]|nr:hypothetical protein [Candidatus Omnitrophota bacterium]
MTDNIFKKTVFISLVGHMSLFGFFSLTFGTKMPAANFSSIAFWGDVLTSAETNRPYVSGTRANAEAWARGKLQPKRDDAGLNLRQAILDGVKPQQPVVFSGRKVEPAQKLFSKFSPQRKKDQVIIFHPILPHNFFLYFTDRQIAHVELMFKAPPAGGHKPIMLKRKISSGSLEADLLTMRYMGHYFFIHQAVFSPEVWQTIKIDLSARE